MARTKAEILAELTRLAPWWLRPITAKSVEVASGELAAGAVSRVLDGLAAVLALGEVARDEWRAQTRRETASGAYLDSPGAERQVEQWPGETEAAYRARLVEVASGCTPEAMRRALAAYAAHIGWPGAVPVVNEPRLRFCDLTGEDDGFFCDDPLSLTCAEAPVRLAWLHLPEIGSLTSDPAGYMFVDSGFCDNDYTGEDTRDPLSRWIYRDFLALAEAYRPAGVAMGATIEDGALMADEILALLMQQGGGALL